MLIQAAAGGVGLFLVQLAKIFGISQVIALASSDSKLELARSRGADVVFNYAERGWIDQVREATQGKGVELVLESASGEVGKESLKLTAPFGRIVMFGAKNVHDTLTPEIIQQLIYKNQTLTGFNIPSLPPQEIGEAVPALLELISQKRIRLFAQQAYPLDQARAAFAAVAGRKTIGKVVLIPGDPN